MSAETTERQGRVGALNQRWRDEVELSVTCLRALYPVRTMHRFTRAEVATQAGLTPAQVARIEQAGTRTTQAEVHAVWDALHELIRTRA